MDLITQPTKGLKILELFRNISTYKSDIPTNVGILALIQMQYYIFRINSWAKTIPKDDAAAAPDAHYWDSMTVETWL